MALEDETSQVNERAVVLEQLFADINVQVNTLVFNNSGTAAALAKANSAADRAEANTGTPTPQPTYNGFVVEGDSIDAGGGQNDQAWPGLFQNLVGKPVLNIATPGDTLSQMYNNYYNAGSVGSSYDVNHKTLILAGGTNDISLDNQTVARLKELYYGFAHRARETGYTKIYIMTLLPRAVGQWGWTQSMEDRRIEINAAIRSDYSLYGADGFIDRANAITLADLFDGLHPSNAGAAKIAQVTQTTLNGGGVVTPVPDEITNEDGSINTTKWTTLANNYWTETAVNYRMGPASAPVAGRPTWYGDYTDIKVGHGYPDTRVYQLGNFVDEYTDFSSTELHSAFVPDDPAVRIGALGIQGVSFSNYTASIKPVNNWTRYGGKGMDGVEAQYWREHGYPTLSKPTCMSNGKGRPTWNVQSIVAFQDGSMCTVGTNTDSNTSFGKLPAGLIPTSSAVMSSNEFMLFTVWNTNLNRGEVAMVVLCGLGGGSTMENPDSGEPGGWWGEWNRAYPGLQNLGNNRFFKYVGSLPLQGMMAPTGISCTTGQHRHAYLNGTPPISNGGLSNWVEDESVRQRWVKPNGDRVTNLVRQGMFMVWSKTEKKVQFYDCRPWFDYINKYYFGTRSDFLKTRDIGQNPNQWPFSFDVAPEQKPTFIKEFTLPSAPTAGLLFNFCYQDAHRQAWLALDEGKMWTFNTGDFARPYDGVPDAYPGIPSQLVKVAETPIDPGTTAITHMRERGPNDRGVRDHTRQLFLTSRKTKYVSHYDMVDPNGPGVLKWRTSDSRWVDPVHAEDMECHGTESYVLEVADFNGKKIHALGYGPIMLHTMGGTVYNLRNNEPFNYFGNYPVEGKPFVTLGANVS